MAPVPSTKYQVLVTDPGHGNDVINTDTYMYQGFVTKSGMRATKSLNGSRFFLYPPYLFIPPNLIITNIDC